jgi:transposase-like protein
MPSEPAFTRNTASKPLEPACTPYVYLDGIVRILRETQRRTRVVGAFPDGQSALNLAAPRLRHIVDILGPRSTPSWRSLTRQRPRAMWPRKDSFANELDADFW